MKNRLLPCPRERAAARPEAGRRFFVHKAPDTGYRPFRAKHDCGADLSHGPRRIFSLAANRSADNT